MLTTRRGHRGPERVGCCALARVVVIVRGVHACGVAPSLGYTLAMTTMMYTSHKALHTMPVTIPAVAMPLPCCTPPASRI